jgi:hypothetical protein
MYAWLTHRLNAVRQLAILRHTQFVRMCHVVSLRPAVHKVTNIRQASCRRQCVVLHSTKKRTPQQNLHSTTNWRRGSPSTFSRGQPTAGGPVPVQQPCTQCACVTELYFAHRDMYLCLQRDLSHQTAVVSGLVFWNVALYSGQHTQTFRRCAEVSSSKCLAPGNMKVLGSFLTSEC